MWFDFLINVETLNKYYVKCGYTDKKTTLSRVWGGVRSVLWGRAVLSPLLTQFLTTRNSIDYSRTTTNENLTRKMRNESRFKDEGDTREQSLVIHENMKHEEDRTEDREER